MYSWGSPNQANPQTGSAFLSQPFAAQDETVQQSSLRLCYWFCPLLWFYSPKQLKIHRPCVVFLQFDNRQFFSSILVTRSASISSLQQINQLKQSQFSPAGYFHLILRWSMNSAEFAQPEVEDHCPNYLWLCALHSLNIGRNVPVSCKESFTTFDKSLLHRLPITVKVSLRAL